MKHGLVILSASLSLAFAADLDCDLSAYKPQDSLKAQVRGGGVEVTWQGERRAQLRAGFTIQGGQPVVQELAARKDNGSWIVLGKNLVPEFEVTTGLRRLTTQQVAPLKELNVALTPDVINREKWNAFWDARLMVPGRPGTNLDLPRKPEEIKRAWAKYTATGCQVKTDGARLEIVFPGVSVGVFSGSLQYTIYRGTNLVRQEVIAKTDEPSVAYKYVESFGGEYEIISRPGAGTVVRFAIPYASTSPFEFRRRALVGIAAFAWGLVLCLGKITPIGLSICLLGAIGAVREYLAYRRVRLLV